MKVALLHPEVLHRQFLRNIISEPPFWHFYEILFIFIRYTLFYHWIVMVHQKIQSTNSDSICKWRVIGFRILFGIFLIGCSFTICWFSLKPNLLFIGLHWVKQQGYWGNLIVVLLFGLISMPFVFTGYTFIALASGFLYRLLEGLCSFSFCDRWFDS